MDPLTILATFAPFAVDLGKSLINRFIAGDTFKPANIDEYLKMRQMDLDFFKTMNDAGGTKAIDDRIDHYFSSSGYYLFGSCDLIRRIVSSFYQHIRQNTIY